MNIVNCVKNTLDITLKPITKTLINYNIWSQQNHKDPKYRMYHSTFTILLLIKDSINYFKFFKNIDEISEQQKINKFCDLFGILCFGWVFADMLSVNRRFLHLFDQPTADYQRWQKKVFPLLSFLLVVGFSLAMYDLTQPNRTHNNSDQINKGDKFDDVISTAFSNIILILGQTTILPTILYFTVLKWSQPKFSNINIRQALQQNLLQDAMERIVNARRENNAPPIQVLSLEEIEEIELKDNQIEQDKELKIQVDDSQGGSSQQPIVEDEIISSNISSLRKQNCPICLEPLKSKINENDENDENQNTDQEEKEYIVEESEIDLDFASENNNPNIERDNLNSSPDASDASDASDSFDLVINTDQDMEVDSNEEESNRVDSSEWKALAKLPCDHLYHLTCLEMWYTGNIHNGNHCPECREPFSIPDDIGIN